MKINRVFYLLLPSLLISFVRVDCVSIAAQSDPPIQTDKNIYSVVLTPQDFRLLIEWTYTNRTNAIVYKTSAVTSAMRLEKKVEDKWVVAVGFHQSAGPLNELVSINPGST